MAERNAWPAVELDPVSRRPVFAKDEIELLVQDGCSVLAADNKTALFARGVLRLTTHRLLWVDPAYSAAHALPHAAVATLEEHNSGMVGSRKSQACRQSCICLSLTRTAHLRYACIC